MIAMVSKVFSMQSDAVMECSEEGERVEMLVPKVE